MIRKIGVFDSGSGGLTTLAEIRRLLPEMDYYYIGDVVHCPYGTKSDAELKAITTAVVERLQSWGAQLVVIACNTATTRCIRHLRQTFPNIVFVGTEPAIKVAHDLGSHRPLLLATPATTHARPVQRLVNTNYPESTNLAQSDSRITILPCPGLADATEQALDLAHEFILMPGKPFPDIILHPAQLSTLRGHLETILRPLGDLDRFDSVILGCTHYVILRELIQSYFPNATLIDGNAGVARRVKSLV